MITRYKLSSLWLCIALLSCSPRCLEASVACNGTYNPCEELFWKGSECRNGYCSNPFEKGCLYTILNSPDDYDGIPSISDGTRKRLSSLIERAKSQVRVCNSYDPPGAAEQGLCVSHYTTSNTGDGKNYNNHKHQNNYQNEEFMQHELFAEYLETRIHNQNWESSFFSAWILQILLSEILQVPSTIESGSLDLSQQNNFYDPEARLGYGTANDFLAFQESSKAEGSDCAKVQADAETNGEDYKACAHVALEYWQGTIFTYEDQFAAGNVDPLQPLGAIGLQAIFGK